ncbi:hypothetical protein F3G64_34070 [Pseudomonas aeruginosa]|nr:hypothetical protein F3G64_34070 [Pseudomonas aeruginosa]
MAKSAMTQLGKIRRDRNISVKVKTKLVRTLVFSIFSYGAETWSLKSADRRRIDAFEMWCWRKMLRIPWTAFRTNVSILQELKISSRLSSECLRRILEYFGHIARKDGSNLERLIVTGKVDGKRPRGRSPIRWSDQIRTALDSTFHNALHIARDKNKWRKIVRAKVIKKGGHDPQQ